MSKQNKILETFYSKVIQPPFYHSWSIDNDKIIYEDLIYNPNTIIKYVETSCREDNDYFDDIPPPSKKQQIKNKLFQVINLLKREKQKDKVYSEDGIVRMNNAIKIYLNYMYPNNSLKNDLCYIVDES